MGRIMVISFLYGEVREAILALLELCCCSPCRIRPAAQSGLGIFRVFPPVIFKWPFLVPEQVGGKSMIASGELKISSLCCRVALT